MILVLSCGVGTPTPTAGPPPVLPDPHDHVVDVSGIGAPADIADDFAVVAVDLDASLVREDIVTSTAGTYRAFTVSDSSFRIFFEPLPAGPTLEIQGLPGPWRPFSSLVWVTDNILVFDRWSQPHYGIHYAVDAQTRTLLRAAPFPDRLTYWLAFRPAEEGYEHQVLDGAPVVTPTVPLQADLDANGVPEIVRWEGERVRVERDGETVWQSEPEWRVVDVATGDFWNDYRQEVLLAMWKDDDAGVPRSHPFIMGHRHGRYDLLWGGSAVAAPIRDLDLGDADGDGQNELVVLEGRYEDPVNAPACFVTVWRWNGWGFTLLWRSAEGQYDSLHLLDVDGDGDVEIVVRQNW